MKILQFSDFHWDADPDRLEKCLAAGSFIIKQIEELKPDLLVFSGDWFNKRQTLTDNSAVNPSARVLMMMANYAPIVMIYGNASHDAPGSLEVLSYMGTKHPIYIASRAQTIDFADGKFEYHGLSSPDAILHLFPYPDKSWFLAEKEAQSIDQANLAIVEGLKKIFMGFGAISVAGKCPVIFVGHGNISGSVLSTGQTLISQDIMLSKHDIELAHADCYMFGHIHKAQGWYSGSVYATNFGETEQKEIRLHTFEGKKYKGFERIVIPGRGLALHEMWWNEEEKCFLKDGTIDMFFDDFSGNDLRVRVHLTKEQTITDEYVKQYFPGAYSYQIERIIIPEERIRSSEIVKAKTLGDKFIEWGKSIDKEIEPEVLAIAHTIKEKAQ